MLVAAHNLTVSYPGQGEPRLALHGVSAGVGVGEIVGIVGESGSGKSTLGMALAGMLPGSARVRGGELTWSRPARAALIPQSVSPTFSPYLRCGAQVCDVLLARGCGRREAAPRAFELLEEAGLPATRNAFAAWPHELSGGELQRVAIARALAMQPELLVADECAASLDLLAADALRRTLCALRERRKLAIVWITHDLSELPGFANRVLTLQGGRIVDTFPANPFPGGPLHASTARLLAAIPRPEFAAAPGEEPL